MGSTPDQQGRELHTHQEHWTTISLEERDDGDWLATQAGVPVEGHGETAADAAAEYCRLISEGEHA